MTTIFYPDLSHYDLQRGVSIEDNTVAAVVKVTHGVLFVDSGFATYRQQAQAKGAFLAGYHWLNHGNVAAQATAYFKAAGKLPAMIDAEDTSRNDGYNGVLTVDDIVGFAQALRALGGTCNLVYLPHWYWQQNMGSPDLTPLAAAGLHLVSSNYTTYSDAGPGWAPYGGMTPVAWQYTNALPYGGGTSDFNAFQGTTADLEALFTKEAPSMTLTPQEYAEIVQGGLDDNNVLHWRLRGIQDQDDPDLAKTKFGKPTAPGLVQLDKKLDAILAAVKAEGVPAISDAQVAALADAVEAKLKAAGSIPTDASVVADVKQALREGTAAPAV